MIGRWTTAWRRLTMTLAASAVAVGAAATSAAADQVISAKTDPTAAADAMNSAPMVYKPQYDKKGNQIEGIWSCDPSANCTYVNNTDKDDWPRGWGPQIIIGDGGYNCADGDNQGATAEIGFEVEQEAVQSTELEESLKVKASLGFFGLAETSVEAEVNSGQFTSFATSITTGISVTLPPLYTGYLAYQVWQVTAPNSSVSWLDPITKLNTTVKDLDMSFPGYRSSRDAANTFQFITHKRPMTDAELTNICHSVTGVTPTRAAASMKLTVCASGDCNAVRVNGVPPGSIRRGTVVVRDADTGQAVAKGTVAQGRIRVNSSQPLASGDIYKLVIREPKKRIPHSQGNYATVRPQTRIPITIR